jgi:hypothetical protein
MLVICSGMYRSASTWQYNVAAHLLEQHGACERLGYCFDPAPLRERGDERQSRSRWQVVKAHEAHPVFAEMLARGEALALYAFRDLRDVAYSLVHKANSTFETMIEGGPILEQAVANFRFWTGLPRTLTQQYECLVSDPVRGVRAIAAHLDIDLSPGAAEEVAREFSLERNRERAKQVAERYRALGVDLRDPANALCRDEPTQWHWNHIRDGRVGGWRDVASPRQLAVLARRCGPWLIEQQYEPDYAWARSALEYLLFAEHDRMQACLADARCEGQAAQERADRAGLRLQEQESHYRPLVVRLRELEQLGPFALRLARAVHELAVRHPRIRSVLKGSLLALRRWHRQAVARGLFPAIPSRTAVAK